MKNIKRIIRNGVKNFRRGGVVSASSVLVLTIMLSVLISLFLVRAVLTTSLQELKERFDVIVYMTPSATEDKILALQKIIQAGPYIKDVTYTSKDAVLAEFEIRHKTDSGSLQALEEVGSNPFGGMLTIRATDSEKYEEVGKFLSEDKKIVDEGSSSIEKITFNQNKPLIEKLNTIIKSVTQIGLGIVILFAAIAILIIYTMVRLGIYISRDEISVMRLVGASKWYIRAPFLVEGAISGVIASLVSLVAFIPITHILQAHFAEFFWFNIATYYTSHLAVFILISFGLSFSLTGISSLLATKRYLKK